MNEPPAESPDPLRAWLEATRGDGRERPAAGGDEPSAAGGPSRRLIATTAVVCATAVLLGVAAARRPAGAPPVPAAEQATAALQPAAPRKAVPPPAAGDPAQAIAAEAVLAVRAASDPAVYIDTAAVAGITAGEGYDLVVVRAMEMHKLDGGWSEPLSATYVVPVGDGEAGPAALSKPWRLPAAAAGVLEPRWRRLDDHDVADGAARAVSAAGYADLGDMRVASAPELPDVVQARVHATAPGEQRRRTHTIWLTADATAVLGAPPVAQLPIPGGQP